MPTTSGVGGIVEEPLAMISTYLRGDRNLSPTAAGALEQIIKITYDRLRNKD